MKNIITIITIVFFINFTKGQDTVLYHSYTATASSWDIIKWNVKDTINIPYILQETVDNNGRVKKLEFLKNGKLIGDILCYLANKVTFEYNSNKIIETLYQGNEVPLATDCEMYYKTIYYLDADGFITKTESFAKYDFSKSSKLEITQLQESVPEYVVKLAENETDMQINYYYHSFAKMNGIYPVQKNFKFTNEDYYGNEPEKASIEKGIRRLRKN
jgi:hypothetical protein